MLKDVHLLEAALVTDKSVTALDEKIRIRFARLCSYCTKIQTIIWVNPDLAGDEAIAWLENGALPEQHRQLKFYAGD